MPTPVRKKRVRRPKAVTAAKAVRAITKATPSLGALQGSPAKTRKSATRKPANRSAGRKKTATKATPAPSAIGKGTWRQARFTGVTGSRAYRVYIPQGLRKTTGAPLLLALHGCGQDALEFAASTRFNDLADKHKFVVVYPEQSVTHNGQRCWNWFRTAHQFRTQGEPAIMAGIVRRVILETTSWRIDPGRIYVSGISAGGAMAVVLAATYPELFAAVGVHSATPYRSAASPANALAAMQGLGSAPHMEAVATDAMPPMIVFQGTSDGTVRSVNAQRIADQWLAYHDHSMRGQGGANRAVALRSRRARTSPARPTSARSKRGYTVSRWYDGTEKVLEMWVVDGLGHAWSGGASKFAYSDPRGPRATTEMWKFFAAHRSAAAAAAIRAG